MRTHSAADTDFIGGLLSLDRGISVSVDIKDQTNEKILHRIHFDVTNYIWRLSMKQHAFNLWGVSAGHITHSHHLGEVLRRVCCSALFSFLGVFVDKTNVLMMVCSMDIVTITMLGILTTLVDLELLKLYFSFFFELKSSLHTL